MCKAKPRTVISKYAKPITPALIPKNNLLIKPNIEY